MRASRSANGAVKRRAEGGDVNKRYQRDRLVPSLHAGDVLSKVEGKVGAERRGLEDGCQGRGKQVEAPRRKDRDQLQGWGQRPSSFKAQGRLCSFEENGEVRQQGGVVVGVEAGP